MRIRTLQELQTDLQEVLKPYLGQQQSGTMERDAQDTVDRYFRKCHARAIHTVLGDAGLRVIGVRLGFDIGAIGIKNILTSYWPNDQYAVLHTIKNAIALGYCNNYQLYIEKRDSYPILVARYGMAACFTEWCPKTQGVPPASSMFFVALERAKQLGYLDYLGTP